MKSVKRVAAAMLVAVLATLGLATPAFAAGTYGGAGTPFKVSLWNVEYHGSLPQPPSSVPTSSTISSVTYSLNWTSVGITPSGSSKYLCADNTSTCIPAYQFTNTTSAFNGLPASSTNFFVVVYWYNGFSSGTIAGGPITFTTDLQVSYT